MTGTLPVLWTGTPVAFECVEAVAVATCAACGGGAPRLKRLAGLGRPLCQTCYMRARRAAEAAFEDLRTVALGITIGDLYSSLVGKGLAPRTITQYMRTIWAAEAWFAAGGWFLARATPEQVCAYAETKPMTFATRSNLRISLGHYWELAEHPSPPTRAVRVPRKEAMVCRALNHDDAVVLAGAARGRRDRQGLAVLLGIYQAMRRAEIAGLPWAAVDDVEKGWIKVFGKGAKTRTIPLHPRVVEALANTPRRGEWVFPGQSGGPVGPATVWNWVQLVCEEAGLPPVRPHWLRHTALATQNDRTTDLRTVQHFAGHARPETTAGYTRASKARLVEAVMALDY